MASQEYSVGAKRVFAVVVVAIIVVVAIVSYAATPGVKVASSSASSASAAQSSTFYSTTSLLGLRLQVQLNTSTFQSGSGITAQIAIFNTLDQNLSLTPTYQVNSTIAEWDNYDFFCGASGGPLLRVVSYALFQGNYSAANVSLAGGPLQLAPQVPISCVTVAEPDSITFLPENDSAVLSMPYGGVTPGLVTVAASTEACTSPAPGEFDYGAGRGLSGYWNSTGIPPGSLGCEIGSKYFTYFPPGEYTLAVEDVWNQTLYAHFQVNAASGTTSGAISTDSALLARCSSSQGSGSQGGGQAFGTVTAGTSSPAVICVQLYDYSATPVTLNLTSALSIQALQYVYNGNVGTPRSFSGQANFTVSVSQPQVTIGGPNNTNEGIIVAYAVTANEGASGTYQLGYLPSTSLSTWILGAQEPEQCGYYGQLVAGNGQPNYVQPTGCITYSTTYQSSSTATSSSGSPTIPGIPYQLISGDLYFRVVGVTSSTG